MELQTLLNLGSSALKEAAISNAAKQYVLANRPLYKLLKRAADRYIGGEEIMETLEKVKLSNMEGFKCSVEFMGENVGSVDEANIATKEFKHICQQIGINQLNSTLSLDLSHIGLNLSSEICLQNLLTICGEASKWDIEINISAEEPDKTDQILSIYKTASSMTNVLAITLQAYLYRTKYDFDEIKLLPGRIRIVKGAFITTPGISMPRGAALDQVYLDYIAELLQQSHPCSIATHHHDIQQEAKNLVDFYKPKHEDYEFESLYGIQTQQLRTLRDEGYHTKLYYVYGKEWYLYLCNRLSEYPLNVFRALADICDQELSLEFK